MKFSTTLALCAAPLAMAKAIQNDYPARRDMIAPRKPQLGVLSGELAALGLSGLGITAGAATEVILVWVNPGAGAQTTIINNIGGGVAAATSVPQAASVLSPAAASSAAAAPASATTHQVTVGGAAGLVYTPSSITAAVGDMVVFTFMSTNHTVTQSSFGTPCVAMAGGMDSGFQPNADNAVNPPPQVAMQVMVDTPLWFYCRQTGHCGKGMAFSINPTADKTQAEFQAAAIAQNGTGSATAITGGTSDNTTSSSTTTTAAAAAAATTSTSSSGVTTGTGSLTNGQCVCAVACAVGSLPAADVQGLDAFGGVAGSLPMAMSEPVINAGLI